MASKKDSIAHIEDLDPSEFIDAVRRIAEMNVSEELDGSDFYMGLDQEGDLYTARSVKGEKFYDEKEFPYLASFNGFRGVHAALQAKSAEIKSILAPGDVVLLQVIYGRQPNAVTYGLDDKNFIVFADGIDETDDAKVDRLSSTLQNQEVQVKSVIVDSTDGVNIDQKAVSQTFRFVNEPVVQAGSLRDLNLSKELQDLENFLDAKSGVQELSNYELIGISLGSIPKDEREEAKAIKDAAINTVSTKFKLPIKKILLTAFVKKVRPALGASNQTADEDNGVSGVKFTDPKTGRKLKIVDSSSHKTIGEFNNAIRSQLSGIIRTTDDSAPLEARGGVIGQMRIRIADLLGNKDLALTRNATEIFKAALGSTPTETIRAVSKTLNGADDFNGVKRKIVAILKATQDEASEMLSKFNHHRDSTDSTYRLKLKDGKAIGMSPEAIKKTLLAFAETKRNLAEMLGRINDAGTFDQIVAALYGRAAKAAHKDVVSEGLLEELTLLETRNYTSTERYKAVPDAWTMLNIYLATVFMAVTIYKANDSQGRRQWLRDKANYRMTKYDPNMSPLNFWGYAVWKSGTPAVVKLVSKKVAAELFKIIRKVPAQWVKFLHMDLSFGHDVPIDWQDHYKTLKYLMAHAPGLSTDRIKALLDGAMKYDTLTFDEKAKYLPKLYFYAQQFVPTSPLFIRIKVIQHELLATGGDDAESSPIVMTKGQKLLGEDGEIGTGPAPASAVAPSSSTANSTSTQNIAPLENRIGTKRTIVRRKRNPEIVFKKFERPTPGSTK